MKIPNIVLDEIKEVMVKSHEHDPWSIGAVNLIFNRFKTEMNKSDRMRELVLDHNIEVISNFMDLLKSYSIDIPEEVFLEFFEA